MEILRWRGCDGGQTAGSASDFCLRGHVHLRLSELIQTVQPPQKTSWEEFRLQSAPPSDLNVSVSAMAAEIK